MNAPHKWVSADVFSGARSGEPFEQVLARMATAPAWRSFDERAVEFIGALSRALLRHPHIKEHPELASLAHWFRPAALRDLAATQRPGERSASLMLGRGMAFHVAPANVDSIWAYSCLLSLLAGNTNIVRVSRTLSPQFSLLMAVLAQILADEAGASMRERLVVMTYEHDDALTTAISQACHLRVVWGGDGTVAALRALPLRPTAHELYFPDRFSLAAFKATAAFACDGEALARLSQQFCNDAFWFAQQACSSPRLIAWIGKSVDIREARDKFWRAVGVELLRRRQEDTPAMAMERTVAAFRLVGAGVAKLEHALGYWPLRLDLQRPLGAEAKQWHCGNGLFLEREFPSLQALSPELTDKEQTLITHGFEREELADFVLSLPPRAVDRIVPVGQALQFSPWWDGHNLLQAFARHVALPLHNS